MAMDYDDVVKQGYVKMKSRTLAVWQRRWIILRKPSSKGTRRLEKYTEERFANIGALPQKTVELTNVKCISRLPEDIRKYAVAICLKDGSSRQFSCESEHEADEWVHALTQECLESPTLLRNVDLLDSGPTQRELHERFHVYLVQSPYLEIFGECMMQITPENIYLLDINLPNKRLLTWPLSALRRYGRDDSKFTFEAGRHCDSGEGIFVFNTKEGEAIYQKVHRATLAIAETHRHLNRQYLRNHSTGDLAGLPVSPTRSRSLPAHHGSHAIHRPALHMSVSLPCATEIETATLPPAPPPPPPMDTLERPPLPIRPELMSGRPLPEIPLEGNESEDEYIYEEKGLNPEFRKFLKTRKEDPT